MIGYGKRCYQLLTPNAQPPENCFMGWGAEAIFNHQGVRLNKCGEGKIYQEEQGNTKKRELPE